VAVSGLVGVWLLGLVVVGGGVMCCGFFIFGVFVCVNRLCVGHGLCVVGVGFALFFFAVCIGQWCLLYDGCCVFFFVLVSVVIFFVVLASGLFCC